jgi:hypothetical protein
VIRVGKQKRIKYINGSETIHYGTCLSWVFFKVLE